MSSDREIVCARIVFPDSEFDAKKGRGEIPTCMKLFFGLHNGQVRLDSPAPAMFSHTTV